MEAAIAELPEDNPLRLVTPATLAEYLELHEANLMRAQVLDTGLRADGRHCDEIRPITVEVGVLPRVHGSGLFTRGTTQVLSIATLGTAGDAQKLDSVDPIKEKRYMRHYNFPDFPSVKLTQSVVLDGAKSVTGRWLKERYCRFYHRKRSLML